MANLHSEEEPIPEGLLEGAILAAKAYNAALARGEIKEPALTTLQALELVAQGLSEEGVDRPPPRENFDTPPEKGFGVPTKYTVADFVHSKGTALLADLVELTPDGELRLIPRANLQYPREIFSSRGTVAAHMARAITEAFQRAHATGIHRELLVKKVPEVIRWLEAGQSFEIHHYKSEVKINPVPDHLRDAVTVCLRFTTDGGELEFVGDHQTPLPEKFSSLDVVATPWRTLKRKLSCKPPTEWLQMKRDLLKEWRNEVESRALGIVDSAVRAVAAGNLDIPAAPHVSTILKLLLKGAWGTGECSNVCHSISSMKSAMRAALLKCLVVGEENQAPLVFKKEHLPETLPEENKGHSGA